MSRYIDPKPQYLLNNGDIASDGKLYYFENLDYLTPKDTYDINGVVNTNPVVLDGSGRVPEIFGVDLYSVRLVSAAGETQWTVDNYNMSTGSSTPSFVNPVITGNITLATLGAKILGDFSNSTPANRAAIQTSVLNGSTTLDIMPNGSGFESGISLFFRQDRSNSEYLNISTPSGSPIIRTRATGSATAAGNIFIGINTALYWRFDASGFSPYDDNFSNIGSLTNRVATIYAANGTIQTSDERTKKDIQECQLGLDFINNLNPVSYKFISGGRRLVHGGSDELPFGQKSEDVPGQRTHYGLISQQVKAAADAAGVDFGGWILTNTDDPESQQGLRYDQFIAPLVKAVQELSEQNLNLLERLEALEGVINP